MNEQQQKCLAKQLAEEQLAGANSFIHMNYRCSPSTASSGSNGVMDKAKEPAILPATLNSQASGAARWLHDVSLSSKTSSTGRSCHDLADLASLSSQSPLGSSETAQKPASLRNPLLTWTTEELELVSHMRQGMKNTSRRKRSKKPKDAPKRPLR